MSRSSGRFCGHVGVQQVERNAAHLRAPDLRGDRAARRSCTSTVSGLPVGAAFQADRQVVKVVVLVGFLLPAGGVEVLAEIALLVEQPDADQRHAQVAGGLQVIAGQHAQAAGENRTGTR